MFAAYGIDVLDQRVTPRRIWTLLRRLPAGRWPDPESASSWSIESHLLASVIDSLAGLTYVTLKANGANPATPRPFPRPKAVPGRPQGASPGRAATPWADLAKALIGTPEVVQNA